MRNIIILFSLIFTFGVSSFVSAQEKTFLERLNEADPDAVEAVVQYPEDIRTSIFEASLYPEALIRMKLLQARSMREFQAYLEGYDEELQKKLWEMTRYPNLVAYMSQGQKTPENLLAYLQDYPSEIHTMVLELNGYQHDAVASLGALNQSTGQAFEALLQDYPESARAALKVLITMPDVLEVLTDNIEYTTELGDLYREDPEKVKMKATELHEAALEASDAAEADWYNSLTSDANAMDDLQKTAMIFKEEESDTPEYVYTIKYEEPKPDVKVAVYASYYAYPYWYGYPRWYRHSSWYHHHWTWHAGYYIASDGTVVIVSTPSYYYSSWYWYSYPYAYPYLAYHYAWHYNHHRHFSHGAADAVRDWARDNKDRLPDDWDRQALKGADWFKERGEFENRFESFRENNPDLDISREAFLQQNAENFPNLSSKVEEAAGTGVLRENFVERRDDTRFKREEWSERDRRQRTSENLERRWERKKRDRAGRDGSRRERSGDRRRPRRK